MKDTFKGMNIIERKDVPEGIFYIVNENDFYIKYPLRKNGQKDMRFSVNKSWRLFRMVDKHLNIVWPTGSWIKFYYVQMLVNSLCGWQNR